MVKLRSAFELTKTLHISPTRASYGVSFVSYLKKEGHQISRLHCIETDRRPSPGTMMTSWILYIIVICFLMCDIYYVLISVNGVKRKTILIISRIKNGMKFTHPQSKKIVFPKREIMRKGLIVCVSSFLFHSCRWGFYVTEDTRVLWCCPLIYRSKGWIREFLMRRKKNIAVRVTELDLIDHSWKWKKLNLWRFLMRNSNLRLTDNLKDLWRKFVRRCKL